MIELKDYQSKAIKELTDKARNFLKRDEKAVVTFKSPTGSGKTLMVSEFLKNIARIPNMNISVVWISVRMLHEQSKEKLERYFEDLKLIKCSYFSDLVDRKIDVNEILFINWESINRRNVNIVVRENEQDNNLNSVINNTKDDGRKIILIIDESHNTANSDRSKELVNIISPDITIEVSATPIIKQYDINVQVGRVEVKLSEVIAEEMIKREISVNPEFLSIKVNGKTSDELVISQAIKKREQLAQLYRDQGRTINPLLLIQLPDNRGGEADQKKDFIMKYLDSQFDINVSNNRLAIWLSDDKSDNLANIEKNDNEVEVLIFKQAIAVGWDCPRASILVIFREMKSFTFTIQTVGRIMRMPEFKYYTCEDLNVAYVFTNLENIILEGDEAKNYFTVFESSRDSIYKEIKLRSVYVKRQRERTRLSGKFVKIFQRVAEELNVAQRVNLYPETITDLVIAEGTIEDVDQPGQIVAKGKIPIPSTSEELDQKFDMFVRKNASPYAPVDSSDRIKTALYTFLRDKFGIQRYSEEAQRIVLGGDNTVIFEEALQRSKDIYQQDVVATLKAQGEFVEEPNWEVPMVISYNEKYFQFISKKSIMQPFYIYSEASQPEKNFIKLLDSSEDVVWWFKNRENDPRYFSIGYIDDEGFKSTFYVDFIVLFKDGRLGLFDTKMGITASEKYTKAKAEALQRYIKEENQKGKNLWGGIVVPPKGTGTTWKINSADTYSEEQNNPLQWSALRL
jgi:type III restriction enzyme